MRYLANKHRSPLFPIGQAEPQAKVDMVTEVVKHSILLPGSLSSRKNNAEWRCCIPIMPLSIRKHACASAGVAAAAVSICPDRCAGGKLVFNKVVAPKVGKP